MEKVAVSGGALIRAMKGRQARVHAGYRASVTIRQPRLLHQRSEMQGSRIPLDLADSIKKLERSSGSEDLLAKRKSMLEAYAKARKSLGGRSSVFAGPGASS